MNYVFIYFITVSTKFDAEQKALWDDNDYLFHRIPRSRWSRDGRDGREIPRSRALPRHPVDNLRRNGSLMGV